MRAASGCCRINPEPGSKTKEDRTQKERPSYEVLDTLKRKTNHAFVGVFGTGHGGRLLQPQQRAGPLLGAARPRVRLHRINHQPAIRAAGSERTISADPDAKRQCRNSAL